MKCFSVICLVALSLNLRAQDECKTLKTCSDWVTNKTGHKYELGKLEKRSLTIENGFQLSEGNADFNFNYLIQNNEFIRIKREDGTYQIVPMKDIKDIQFPLTKQEEIPSSLDFFTVEFSLSSKEKAKNAQLILKKYLSKNGRSLEVANAPKLQITDTGIQLNVMKLIVSELNR